MLPAIIVVASLPLRNQLADPRFIITGGLGYKRKYICYFAQIYLRFCCDFSVAGLLLSDPGRRFGDPAPSALSQYPGGSCVLYVIAGTQRIPYFLSLCCRFCLSICRSLAVLVTFPPFAARFRRMMLCSISSRYSARLLSLLSKSLVMDGVSR